ncbi:MAG: helix-turn-helix transcriptional regulator [Clostridiales bacterium]|nr:helix-turn-helix transcriptional regulator [Clostridiales bacterium]MBR5974224.1 helix-turn-helix transcriptional regulator [Clostridiales bacterium]
MTNLRTIRESHHLTQKELVTHIGCSSAVYSRYEIGTRAIPWEMLIRLSDFYQVPVDYLLGHASVDQVPLSEYEVRLVEASRFSDERAREDALHLLEHYRKQ